MTKIQNLKLIISVFLFLFVFALPVAAETMKSENYELQMGQFNMFAGRKESDSFKLVDTGGQLGPGLYEGEGFTVRSGFGYFKKMEPFSFSISDTKITFERLKPNRAETKKSELTVTLGSATSYKVEAAENHSLVHVSDKKTAISDFTGDDGSCTNPRSGCTWVVKTTYGFGYNLAGDDIAKGFSSEKYFKQFADVSDGEPPETLMAAENIGGKREAEITYKINISKKQKTGVYENAVVFTAVPGY